ncbi:hypothetical protein [Kitasatospora sp. NPDC050463]|uniref:hypothetical protein n=1 Tax=Kitasatospora sp. NPDC050463 TaxID=3155786 RepID=UPI0033F3159E
MPLDAPCKPTPGGYEIQCATIPLAGTLGATILWGPERHRIGMSNAHVLVRPGSPVWQPRQSAPGSRRIGVVEAVCAGKEYPDPDAYFDDGKYRSDALFDFAYFLAGDGETSTEIAGGLYSGPPVVEGQEIALPALETRAPKKGELVQWIGKSTARIQRGEIVDLDRWAFMSRHPNVIGVSGLLKIRPEGGPGENGDSGAALVAVDDRHVVGLYCGSTADNKFEMGSRIPDDSFDLGLSVQVSDATAAFRRKLYEADRPSCVVM